MKHVTKPKKAKKVKVKMQHSVKAEVKVKETPKEEPKTESKGWQSPDTAPALTPVHVKTAEGKTIEAILDGHWYVCVDGKPAVDHIVYDPTGWKPLK